MQLILTAIIYLSYHQKTFVVRFVQQPLASPDNIKPQIILADFMVFKNAFCEIGGYMSNWYS